ncbi:MAG: bifunctional ADP-dependent NAD(P)H-hydrate dehydratase/NAD(P)H-hydrate epimerase [Actinobacteria bacterium]|nr:bifunctional ADP-dependent NAD(P)H-hydrate dehydratase/NAD(P)H-hydrate epimerase [Propionicimonas sp.]MBU3976982.1 bifunctional ADP-dependent NAD(P)H-hydrate dehydratase/NAD(P)H-hydrate epimerase [Actinomycetota bacterium]MBU3986727.1 bifunctional ADP-dependent NAD(P)H-hydrate dehydratase/NAD(P)H-hydrate epimerase [Actinomycetota bacterium]MBU4007121.1 bifunctional ADP-dependent NAD(P)H-hydrate dehydratase/NAD(P)H-hydrate epimerase [Actinomycetota bacterium]MBU4064874.1 bifunctional ADP-depe
MMDGYRVEAIRAAEARAFADIDPFVLMQRAAAGLATAILRRLERPYGSRVLLVVGSGNNGGDALFAGVRLAARGVQVSCWRVAESVHPAGWAALQDVGGREVDAIAALSLLTRVDAVVDGVAGIGSRPGLSQPVALFAQACADLEVPVVAVDLPSGLAPEPPFGEAPHFEAELTVTFGGYKLCHLLEPARSACGDIELVDIGLTLSDPEVHRWTPAEVAAAWPVPDASSDKYARGVVGLDTGSAEYPGAAVLGAAGAIYAGAGMVRYLGPPQVRPRVLDAFANVVGASGRVQALVIGSGWGDRKDGGVLARAMRTGVPMVIDADGLRHLPLPGRPNVVLTPHAGELAFLLGLERAEVAADPLTAVHSAAERTGCTVLLKGATQYVATPGLATVEVAVPGPAWTAQAGSGDVLAGIIGTLLAAELAPATAAVVGASVQAMVAAANPGPLPPQDLVRRLPAWIAEAGA